MLKIFENKNIKKYKWILIILISIVFLIFLNMRKDNDYDNYSLEHIDNIPSNETVRKLEDYYTPKTISETKIINLKSKIGDKDYYLAKIKKDKFNENCPICSVTKVRDSMLVLVDANSTIKENCYADELVKCYNTQNISDCPSHSLKQCDPKKIGTNNIEFILDNITSGLIKDGVVTPPSYALKFNDQKNQGIMMSLWEIENKTSEKSSVKPNKKNFIVCLDDIIGALDNKQKIYLNTDNLPKDKIRFKIFFKIDDQVKYLGVCNNELCPNIICEEKECENNYKFLCLYDDIKNPNVLNFEPELMKHIKNG